MDENQFFLDVNVPMYAAGKSHVYKEACAWILTEIAYEQLPVVIDTEIVQEILYRFGAIRRWRLGGEMANGLLDLVPNIFPVTASDIQKAVQLFSQYGPQGVKARDIIHAAVMHNNGLTKIISTDRHFDLLPNIERLDPMDLYAANE